MRFALAFFVGWFLASCDTAPHEKAAPAAQRPFMSAAAAPGAKADSETTDSVTLAVKVPRVTRYFTRVDTLPSTPPAPRDTVTPPSPPTPTGRGIPMGMSHLPAPAPAPFSFIFALETSPQAIVADIAKARAGHYRIAFNLTGGSHDLYKTAGRFDMAKWAARLQQYNTPAIRQAIAAGVADGTIIGSSVMDEPHQIGTDTKAWAPADGWMTRAKIDSMCAKEHAVFPSLAVGVVHDHRKFDTGHRYNGSCDWIGSQYRYQKESLSSWRASLVQFKKDNHMAAIASINIRDGGAAAKNGKCPVGAPLGGLCQMTPAQIVESGTALGEVACALTMWWYSQAILTDPGNQAAYRTLAGNLAKLPAQSCRPT